MSSGIILPLLILDKALEKYGKLGSEQPIQDQLPPDSPIRLCFGCGADNEHGMRIKSYWEGDEFVCRWAPQAYHTAIGLSILSGGVAATIMDCHSMWTAIATVWRSQGLSATDSNLPMYLTRSLKLDYLRPTPLGQELTLRARVVKVGERSLTVTCSLYAGDVECVRSETVAVRVTP